tara:strand:+ start:212 stop:667 length:456 start_codon:yes stop_codon:yes gene_type:complete
LEKKTINEANKSLSRLYRAVDGFKVDGEADQEILQNLSDDISTPKALARAHYLADQANKGSQECAQKLKNSSSILGILSNSTENWFKYGNSNLINKNVSSINDEEINKLILERKIAKENKDFLKADEIRDLLLKSNIILEDKPGITNWRKS